MLCEDRKTTEISPELYKWVFPEHNMISKPRNSVEEEGRKQAVTPNEIVIHTYGSARRSMISEVEGTGVEDDRISMIR